jgi:hypothetical protein
VKASPKPEMASVPAQTPIRRCWSTNNHGFVLDDNQVHFVAIQHPTTNN